MSTTDLTFECSIDREIYDYADKKYINIKLDEDAVWKINKIQYVSVNINPLVGNILKVKIPFRYRKIEVPVRGDKTVYELKKDDVIMITIKYCGVWKAENLSGYAWKAVLISS